MSAKEEKEKKETREEIKRAAKLIKKRAKLTEELYTQIFHGSAKGPLGEEIRWIKSVFSYCLPAKKDFLLDGVWELEIADYLGWQRGLIKLTVKSDAYTSRNGTYLSGHAEVGQGRVLDVLMRFENSWQEKANFILAILAKVDEEIKRYITGSGSISKFASMLEEIYKKAEAQYEAEEKLEVLQKENEKLITQFHGFILFTRRISEKLEKTKQWVKSKKIAEIREEIEMEIASVIDALSGVDPALLKEWAKEWALKTLNKLKKPEIRDPVKKMM